MHTSTTNMQRASLHSRFQPLPTGILSKNSCLGRSDSYHSAPLLNGDGCIQTLYKKAEDVPSSLLWTTSET